MTANATARPHPSRRAHARSIFLERSRTRAPEREDGSAQPSSRLVAEPLPCRPISRCQTAHVFSFPHADARGLASVSPTQSRGGRSADRRIFLSLSRLSARVSRAGEARRVRCAWTAKRTLAFRRSTVAFVGRGPDFAGASAGKPAKARRRRVALSVSGIAAGSGGPGPPEAAVASRRRRTPHLAPPSGSPPETPLDERGCESSRHFVVKIIIHIVAKRPA
jgi:hypothetical protein